MAIGIGIGLSPSFGGGGGSAPVPIPAPFASVNGSGAYDSWSAEYAATPSVPSPVAFTASRQGYDASGNTTTYLDTLYVTTRVRQPFPNQASNSALTTALSDYIYSTDTPSGSVVNNATLTSPKPVANWVTPARRLVGNTIGGNTVPVEIVAFHRNARAGKEVACVIFRITDGTNTVSATVSTPEVSVYPGDLNSVIVYKLPATDISSLNTGLITVNAEVYPWIGAAASVLNSTASSVGREFSPRYFHKDATKFATPDIMYVSTTGNDATAQVNNSSLPALTITGAINRMRTGSTGAPWSTATTQIRILTAGTYALATSPSGTSNGFGAGLVITRDPGVSKASAVVQFGAGYQPALDGSLPGAVTTAALIITDVATIRTGGALNIARGSTARLEVQCDNVTMDLNATGAALVNNSDLYFYGVEITNNGTGNFGASASGQQRIWRGVSITTPGTTTEAWLHVGCRIVANNSSFTTASGQTQNGQILAFNRYLTIGNASFWSINTAVTTGAAIVQNVFEYTTATQGNAFAVSHDAQTNNTVHVIFHNNTFAGFVQNGRTNLFYDDGGTPRSNTLMSVRGNIFTQINTKSDVYRGVNEGNPEGFTPGSPSTRIGNWGFMYGVGAFDNYTQYIDASNGGLGTSFAMAYAGYGSSIGTSNTTPAMATTNWTDYKAATTGPSAGAGQGTYTLTSGSAPVAGIVDDACLSHDLAGTARTTTGDDAGAYAAP